MTRPVSLPVSIRPLPGETVVGYVGRLAPANGLTFRDLRLHIRDLGNLPEANPDVEKVPGLVEALGGLTEGFFELHARKHCMFVRCSHYGWRPGRCRRCSQPQTPRSECLRCSAGTPTTTRRRGAGVCLHHRRWHLSRRDVNVSRHTEFGRAERWMSGKLWFHGIALHTGELQLAVRLLLAALRDSPDAAERAQRRADEFGVSLDGPYEDALLCVYPEAVALTGILIDPEYLRYLLSPRYKSRDQVEIMQAAVAGVLGGTGGRHLREISRLVVERSQDAVMAAYGAKKAYGVKTISCGLDKALLASARSNRACLLRHLDTVRMPSGWDAPPSWGAPRNSTLNRARLLPDDLDLPLPAPLRDSSGSTDVDGVARSDDGVMPEHDADGAGAGPRHDEPLADKRELVLTLGERA